MHDSDRAGLEQCCGVICAFQPRSTDAMIERIALSEWKAFDLLHPAPTFFARPAWAISLAETNETMCASPLRITTQTLKPLLLPLVRMRGGLFRWRDYRGFPLGGYTCFLHEDGTLAQQSECDAALLELARYADAATIVPWPLTDGPTRFTGAVHETSIVDLAQGVEAAFRSVDGIFRRMAGQAERRGVVCAPSKDPDAVDRYYDLLESSAKRWGLERPTIPKSLLHSLVQNGGSDVEIWFARAEGRIIAGGVVFYGASELFFWSAAMLAEFSRFRPSNALNFALMRAAAERGMTVYNLGSSEGLPGVARFKDSLGATDVAYKDVRLQRARVTIYANARRALNRHAALRRAAQ